MADDGPGFSDFGFNGHDCRSLSQHQRPGNGGGAGYPIHAVSSIAVDRENEDLQSRLALILSSSEMEAPTRQQPGLCCRSSEQIVYLNVPGYEERQAVILAPSNERNVVGARYMPPEYTESIFEWLALHIKTWYSSIIEVQP